MHNPEHCRASRSSYLALLEAAGQGAKFHITKAAKPIRCSFTVVTMLDHLVRQLPTQWLSYVSPGRTISHGSPEFCVWLDTSFDDHIAP